MTVVGWITVALFLGVYVLIATERIHRVKAALGGAAVVPGVEVKPSGA